MQSSFQLHQCGASPKVGEVSTTEPKEALSNPCGRRSSWSLQQFLSCCHLPFLHSIYSTYYNYYTVTSDTDSTKMGFITDKVPVRNGSDFTFVCSRIPFAVSCSSILPHGDHNLIDLDLVLKMKIPLQRIRVEKYPLLGETVRTVGFISQTIQCVQQGRISGNIHIQAKVVRDLYSLYKVDCIASIKTFTRLVGKEPNKLAAPDDYVMDLDGGDGEIDDDGDDDTDLAHDGEDNIVLADEGDDNIVETKAAAADKEDDVPDDNQDEVGIGAIPWNYGCKPVPTVDELYPDDDPADNARWYQELHQPRQPSPRRSLGNKENKYKTNVSTEGNEDKMFCKLCFHEGEPVSVVTSSHNLDISCPTMTDQEKETMFGPNWIARMYGYPD